MTRQKQSNLSRHDSPQKVEFFLSRNTHTPSIFLPWRIPGVRVPGNRNGSREHPIDCTHRGFHGFCVVPLRPSPQRTGVLPFHPKTRMIPAHSRCPPTLFSTVLMQRIMTMDKMVMKRMVVCSKTIHRQYTTRTTRPTGGPTRNFFHTSYCRYPTNCPTRTMNLPFASLSLSLCIRQTAATRHQSVLPSSSLSLFRETVRRSRWLACGLPCMTSLIRECHSGEPLNGTQDALYLFNAIYTKKKLSNPGSIGFPLPQRRPHRRR